MHSLYQKVAAWQCNMADRAAEQQMTKACTQACCVLLRQIMANPASMYEVHFSGFEQNADSTDRQPADDQSLVGMTTHMACAYSR